MSTPYDPALLRDERFARLTAVPLQVVGASSGGALASLRQIVGHREMLDLLVRRDLKSRYKDSSLGFLWVLVRPLTQLAIYYVVIGQFLQAARGIPDFAVYVFGGLTIFGLFSEIVLGGVSSIMNNAGLVKKIYLPREVFPLASVGAALFNFAIQLVVLFAATLLVGKPPWHLDILYAVPAILLALVWGTAFALLLSSVNVYLRDTQYLTEVIMMFLMWASPIVYAWTMVRGLVGDGVLLELYTDNPLTLSVLGFHRSFWVAGTPADFPDHLLVRMVVAIAVGAIALWLCHGVFRRLQGNFAQEL